MVLVKAKELQEWFSKAEKIGRSNSHLSKIKQLIDRKFNHGFGYIDLQQRDFNALTKDNHDYLNYRSKLQNDSQSNKTSNLEKQEINSRKTSSHKKHKKHTDKTNNNDLNTAEKEALYGIIALHTHYKPRL